MSLLKNIVTIGLLLFSFELGKCQRTKQNYEPVDEALIGPCAPAYEDAEYLPCTPVVPLESVLEETVLVECFEEPVVEELIGCQDVPYNEEEFFDFGINEEKNNGEIGEVAVIEGCLEDPEADRNEDYEENPVVEESAVEECQSVPEDNYEENSEICPQFIEEAEVNNHWMTFRSCCVSSEAVCSDWYEPVCVEELRCEADHCRRHYETVTNVCLACRGQNNSMHSIGRCPWESNNQYFRR